jgi:hypothetical protein
MLDADSTRNFTQEISQAVEDARRMEHPGGPNLVIHDDAVRARNFCSDPHAYQGEHVDEAIGLLIRKGVPVLSSSRILERNYRSNQAPMILHHPTDLPLDVRAELTAADVALVIGPAESAHGFLAPTWNPAEGYDPLGDASCLRETLVPEEVVRMAAMLSLRGGLPILEMPVECCVYFHYWRALDGGWRILIGNVECGATDVEVGLSFPLALISSELGKDVRLQTPDGICLTAERGKQALVWRIPLKKNCSIVLRLH